jgi:starch synthase
MTGRSGVSNGVTKPPRRVRNSASVRVRRRARASVLKTNDGEPIHIVHFAAECWPYARSGGLGEAVASLATYQAAARLPTTVVMPLYRQVRTVVSALEPVGAAFPVQLGATKETARLWRAKDTPRGTDMLFIEHPGFFDRPALYGEGGDYRDNHRRFAFFSLAALAALPRIAPGQAILHAHDWHAALSLVYLRTAFAQHRYYRRVPAVLSVHNAGYQGHFPPSTMPEIGLPWELFNWKLLEWYDKVNWLKGGIVSADAVVTVSATHARELQSPDGGFGLGDTFRALRDRLFGITNGIDQDIWDPVHDPHIAARFTSHDLEGKRQCKAALQARFGLAPNPRVPIFGMAARLVAQKGLDLLVDGRALGAADAQYVFLGQGERRYVEPLRQLAAQFPDRIAVETGFTDPLEHVVVAGADMLLMLGLVLGLFRNYQAMNYLLTFVLGHGVLELTAIFISAGAGFRLAKAIISPGDRTRRDALVVEGRIAVRMIGAVVTLLAIAGTIEGLLSTSAAPAVWKYGVSAATAVLLALYLANGYGYLGTCCTVAVRESDTPLAVATIRVVP